MSWCDRVYYQPENQHSGQSFKKGRIFYEPVRLSSGERAFPARSSRRLSSRSSLSQGERIMSWSAMCDLIYLRSCRINRSSLSMSLSIIAPVRLFFPSRSGKSYPDTLTSLTFIVQNITIHRNRYSVCSFHQAPYGCQYKGGLPSFASQLLLIYYSLVKREINTRTPRHLEKKRSVWQR